MCFWWMSNICFYGNFFEFSLTDWLLLIVTCNAILSGAMLFPPVLKIFVAELQQFWKYLLRTKSIIFIFLLLIACTSQKPTAKQKKRLFVILWQRKFLNGDNQTFADRPRTQRSNSVDWSTSSSRIKVSFIQICFRSLLSLKQVCIACFQLFWMHLWSHARFNE